jgi:hypothetical protein
MTVPSSGRFGRRTSYGKWARLRERLEATERNPMTIALIAAGVELFGLAAGVALARAASTH